MSTWCVENQLFPLMYIHIHSLLKSEDLHFPVLVKTEGRKEGRGGREGGKRGERERGGRRRTTRKEGLRYLVGSSQQGYKDRCFTPIRT